MAGHFLVKEIALQAGVGTATVDRVLNARGGVHERTRRCVEQAIRELQSQESLISLTGRTFLVDAIIEAPQHFCIALRRAVAEELPALLPAIFRVRETMEADISDTALLGIVRRVIRRGSHGVILMAAASAATRAAISELKAARIPVVTLATDVLQSDRIAYCGMDNWRAGQTAGYLIGQWLPKKSAKVLVSLRNIRFRGEEERESGFRAILLTKFPYLQPIELYEGSGATASFSRRVVDMLERHRDIKAVYSIGGNNRAILSALATTQSIAHVFIAHDLDDENRALLRNWKISAVLNHDLRRDVRSACRAILHHHRALKEPDPVTSNPIQIITPTSLD
jgi:LacI family transcriptional regulator